MAPEYEDSEANTSTASDVDSWRGLTQVAVDLNGQLDPTEELEHLKAAEEAVLAKDDERVVTETRLNDELAALRDQLEEATRAAARPSGAMTAEQHESHLRELDKKRYAAEKALSEEQQNVAKREGELARARAERDEVRRLDPSAGRAMGEEANVIRLKLFRDFGFSLTGTDPTTILVRSERDGKHDIHPITVGEADRVACANRLWELAA